jgi:hypothetical protein
MVKSSKNENETKEAKYNNYENIWCQRKSKYRNYYGEFFYVAYFPNPPWST